MTLQLLIKDVEDEMCVWLDMKRSIFHALINISERMDEHTKKCRVAKISGSTLGVVGGTLAIVGFGLSFATFGGSLALSVAGASIAATGGITAGGSSVAERVLHNKLRDRALGNLKESVAFLEQFSSNIAEISNLLIPEPEEHVVAKLPKIYNKEEEPESSNYAEAGAAVVMGGKYVVKASNFTNNMISVSNVGQIALATGQALTMFGGVVNIILLPLEVYNVVETAMALHRSLPHDSSTLIRTIADEFDPEKDEPDEELIRTKFVALQKLTLTDIPAAIEAWEELYKLMISTQVNAEDIMTNLDGLLKKAKKKGLNVEEEVAKMYDDMNEDEEELFNQMEALNKHMEEDRVENTIRRQKELEAEEEARRKEEEAIQMEEKAKRKEEEALQKEADDALIRQMEELNRMLEEDRARNEELKLKQKLKLEEEANKISVSASELDTPTPSFEGDLVFDDISAATKERSRSSIFSRKWKR